MRNQPTIGARPSFEAYGGSGPDNYERYFVPAIGAPLAADLLDVAQLRPGDRVLDLACGTGVVARRAASHVGAKGRVVGVDMNPGMLAVAGASMPPGVDVEWCEATADALPLPDETFDAALCQLGLQFFPDRTAALRELHRVLVGGGRAVANVCGPTPPLFLVFEDALRDHLTAETASFVDVVFSLDDPRLLRGYFENAGFADVSVETRRTVLRLPPPAEFLWQYVGSTPLAAVLSSVDHAGRTQLERDVVSGWEEFTHDGTLVLEVDVLTATARRL